MPTAKETREVNFKIAQLKNCLLKDLIKNKYNIKFIFDRINDINCQAAATDYLQLHCANFIGFTALHFAVNRTDFEAFDILLSHGVDLTIKSRDGLTALHDIVQNRQFINSSGHISNQDFVHSVVSAHIRYNNYENSVSPGGLSHFHIACAVNNLEAVVGFLQNGISINHTVKADSPLFPGFSPLHFAVMYNACKVVRVLLSHGANLHIENSQGITPLRMAFEKKLEIKEDIYNSEYSKEKVDKILKMLIEKESIDDILIVDNWGLSHLHIACTLNKDSKTAESYLQKVVNINHAVNMDSPLCPGYTALHFAALYNIDTVKLLVERGADMIKDAKGVTPLDICIRKYKAEDIHAVISLNPIWKNTVLFDGKTILTDLALAMIDPNKKNRFLQKFLKNINDNITISDSLLWPGYTPMHLGVIFFKYNGSSTELDKRIEEILVELYKQNPKMLSSSDVRGYTPLHLAFRLKKQRMCQQLYTILESHVNLVDQVDEDGLSYVHIVAAADNTRLLKKLLSKSANVNAVYTGQPILNSNFRQSPTIYSGSTPLHFAVANGRVETVKMLVKGGADMCAKDVNNMTPVHLLLMNSEADVLLSSPNLRDSVVDGIGLSHLHIACRLNKPEVVKRLLDVGANINGVINITHQQSANLNLGKFSPLSLYNGYSPLYVACHDDNYEIMEILLKRGADLWVKSSQGNGCFQRIIEISNNVFTKHHSIFVKTLIRRVDVQTRLKAEIGMTGLHIACLVCDGTAIKKSLEEGVNVNAQFHTDSPIFQGYTALHVLIHVSDRHDGKAVDKAIKMLVEAGADVTVPNVKSETAVHLASESFNHNKYTGKGKSKYVRVNLLLEAQRDFNVNPVDVGGISHFHIASNVCNLKVIQKFLDHGKIDINKTTDYFQLHVPGYSALHFAAGSQSGFCGAAKQLRTMDLLLKNEANVSVEDGHGDTALLECARSNSLDLFEKLVRGGADVNATNILGNTSLYYYLTSGDPSVEELKTLLRLGCHLNVFNAVTGEGYMGITACKLGYASMQSFLDATIMNFSKEIEPDNWGRSIVHNIVSTDSRGISVNEYVTLIEQRSETDCDVDKQDNSGRTALHMAVKFHNANGIIGLLMIGADINITDINGKTAFACDFNTCDRCEDNFYDYYEDDDGENKCTHVELLESLAFHVKKLTLCGLGVNKQNEEFAHKVFQKMNNKNPQCGKFLRELEIIKNIRIEPHALTLKEFLSENGAVADYPTMSQIEREDINKFFSANVDSLRKKFPEIAGILQLQYRKTRARPELVDLAKNAMELLMGFRLPEICSQVIVVLLSNSELKSLIASVI